MLTTRKRVLQGLDRWREAGWVTEAGAGEIRRELSAGHPLLNFSNTLAILGAVLIGFAAMTFVAANWSAIPRLVRVAMLVSALWAAYGGAGWLFSRGYTKFGEAAVLTGVGLFGANIMLIAQMFHLDGNPNDAVLVWACGAVLAGFAFRSAPSFVAALLLFGLWSAWETSQLNNVHWWFLPAWGLTAVGFAAIRATKSYYFSALALALWIVVSSFVLPGGPYHEIPIICGLIGLLLSAVVGHLGQEADEVEHLLRYFGAGLVFVGLMSWQLDDPSLQVLIALAVVTLVGLIGAMAWAGKVDDRKLMWLAYVGFATELLFLYFKTIGSLLSTSLFFLTAGVIVCGLAVLAMRLHKRSEQATKVEVAS